VILFNRGRTAQTIAVSWQELGLPWDAEPLLRDLWAKKDLGRVKGTYSAEVPAHDIVMLRLTPAAAGDN
jgi:alpha-galactosidase